MRHPIDPMVDYAFKCLLGDPSNVDLLTEFLNEVLELQPPVEALEIINPFSPEEFEGDDHRIVDVRARTPAGAQVQLEVQISVHASLRERVLYTWSDLYQSQLQRGERFHTLRPVLSVWIFRGRVFADSPRWHHRFELWDLDAGQRLSEHCRIHTVELKKWSPGAGPLAKRDAWLYLLREGSACAALPPALRTPSMEKAMSVLERISEKSEDYHRYQARMNALRVQAAFEDEVAGLRKEKDDLTEARDQLSREVGSLEAEKTTLEAEKTTLEAEKTTLEAEKTTLAAEKTTLEAEKTTLAAEKTTLAAEKTTLEAALSAERQAREALEARLRALGLSLDG